MRAFSYSFFIVLKQHHFTFAVFWFLRSTAFAFQTFFFSFCDPMNSSPPGSSVHGISQVRILKWVSISLSKGSSRPMDRNRQVLYHWATREALPFKHFARTSEKENVLKKNVSIWYEICMDMSEWMAHILANIIIIINCYLLCEKEMQLKYTCFEVTNSLFMLLPFA